MTITGIITAILIGIVVGVLGRLLVPGKQPIGMLVTILIGIVGAFLGTAIARALGIPTVTNGIDWLELLVQVIVAAIGVALVSSMMGRRRTGAMGGGRRRSSLFREQLQGEACPAASPVRRARSRSGEDSARINQRLGNAPSPMFHH
jgi:uncharacterized membrane protein YeaQ/YmgE (transglycosylase-associated protein family)